MRVRFVGFAILLWALTTVVVRAQQPAQPLFGVPPANTPGEVQVA